MDSTVVVWHRLHFIWPNCGNKVLQSSYWFWYHKKWSRKKLQHFFVKKNLFTIRPPYEIRRGQITVLPKEWDFVKVAFHYFFLSKHDKNLKFCSLSYTLMFQDADIIIPLLIPSNPQCACEKGTNVKKMIIWVPLMCLFWFGLCH